MVKVENLKKYFNIHKKGVLKAVDNVSFEVYKGETLGLVGESGCGKTTCGRTILNLYPLTDGKVFFDGQDITQMKTNEEQLLFKKNAQIIFQDPYASLDPRMTVGEIIAEGMDNHRLYEGEGRLPRIYELLEQVGLNREHANRFPHEFSGGQRQRIGIARALAVDPQFIVCDEPISALDVSIQAQVVNMLEDLQQEMHLTYLFAAHDLSMVKYISHRIGVMYLGNLVEVAPCGPLYERPLHPYTQALLSAIPVADPRAAQASGRMILKGELPSPMHVPQGCHFSPRCPYANERCRKEKPTAQEAETGHWVSCFRYAEING